MQDWLESRGMYSFEEYPLRENLGNPTYINPLNNPAMRQPVQPPPNYNYV